MPDNPSSELCPPPSPRSGRLDKPMRITEQVWQEGTVPVVSVFCITYNHARFIRETIEGFLMQETTFPVEIFIHDDASTDGTADIVREYQTKYPKLFRSIIQTENQYSQASYNFFFKYISEQRGEYIAVCEGDDYWTDPRKLEKQFLFLEKHKDVSLCGGICKTVDIRSMGGYGGYEFRPRNNAEFFEFKDVAQHWFIHTSTFFFRKTALGKVKLPFAANGDGIIMAILASKGRLGFIHEPFSVYHASSEGAWIGASQRVRCEGLRRLHKAINILLPGKYVEELSAWDVKFSKSQALEALYKHRVKDSLLVYWDCFCAQYRKKPVRVLKNGVILLRAIIWKEISRVTMRLAVKTRLRRLGRSLTSK